MIILHYISLGIGIVGVAVITWGVAVALAELFYIEQARFRGETICESRELLRHHLGSYLLLGLEFLVAADIIGTIVSPTLQELIVLGGIVAIRTIINYSLNKEVVSHPKTERMAKNEPRR